MVNLKTENLDWYKLPVMEIGKILETNLEGGLNEKEASKRLEKYGKNTFGQEAKSGILKIIFRQIFSPLSVVLIVAGIVTLFLKQWPDFAVISLAVLVNVIVGTFQENRADKAFLTLKKSQKKLTTVIRGGDKKIIKSENLVPGDIIEIQAGDKIPADCRVVEHNELRTNEAALTGEWDSVTKQIEPLRDDLVISDQSNMIFSGTLAAAGGGLAVVVKTGGQTQIGKIAKSIKKEIFEKTPFQKSLNKVASFLVLIILTAIIVIFALGISRGENIYDLLLTSIALAVAAVPEGLAIAVTVVLAFGMQQILKRGGLVRNLLAAETLGSTTVILTDKTGTLTKAQMQIQEVVTLESLKGDGQKDEDNVLEMAVMTSNAFVEKNDKGEEVIRGWPIEKAVLEAGIKANLFQKILFKKRPRLDFLKFSSERRFAGAICQWFGNAEKRFIMIGAPEEVLKRSKLIYQNDDEKELTEKNRQLLEEFLEEKTSEGMRLVAIAYRTTRKENFPDGEEKISQYVRDLVFGGFLVIHDPVRKDVKQAIKTAEKAGASVIMLTGDFAGTARYIAQEVGILGKDNLEVVTGSNLQEMSDEILSEKLKTTKVFARMLPHQKMRVANLLKRQGEVVAMTGDGINDAPALRNADIGIAVDSGTEVAKEASDLVLIDNSFSVIVSAIEEGRRILDNLKKITAYLLSTGFSEIIVVGGAILVGMPLPILPVQILWANIVEEGVMNFAFVFEPKEKGIMQRDPKSEEVRNILSKNLKKLIFIMSAVTGVVAFLIYFFASRMGFEIDELRTLIFAIISIDSIFFAFSLKDLKRPFWKINLLSNKFLLVSVAISMLFLLAALFVPIIQTLLSTVSLSLPELGFVLLFGLFNLALIETLKFFIFRNSRMA